jgi:hypothetical protein
VRAEGEPGGQDAYLRDPLRLGEDVGHVSAAVHVHAAVQHGRDHGLRADDRLDRHMQAHLGEQALRLGDVQARVGLGGHHRHYQVRLFRAFRTSRASRAAVAGAGGGCHRDTGHRDGRQGAAPRPGAMAGWHGGAGPGAPCPASQDSSDPAAAW